MERLRRELKPLCSAGAVDFLTDVSRPFLTSWLNVGILFHLLVRFCAVQGYTAGSFFLNTRPACGRLPAVLFFWTPGTFWWDLVPSSKKSATGKGVAGATPLHYTHSDYACQQIFLFEKTATRCLFHPPRIQALLQILRSTWPVFLRQVIKASCQPRPACAGRV
jgi:hypothetical protein